MSFVGSCFSFSFGLSGVKRKQYQVPKLESETVSHIFEHWTRKLEELSSPRAFRLQQSQPKNYSPGSPPALQASPALQEPRRDTRGRLGKLEFATYSPPSPPVMQGAPYPTLKEPRGDMSGGRLSKVSSPPGTLGTSIAVAAPSAPLPAQLIPSSMDTVRFLCDYVAKEEARLGLQTPK